MTMRVLLYSAFLAFANVTAFQPGHQACRSNLFRTVSQFQEPPNANANQCSPSQLSMVNVALSNPLKRLPWNVKKETEREERRLKQEGAMLYRALGVAEDASFEDIQEATATLVARYDGDGDLKKRVNVEITKDKIMQLRLNQRLGGMTRENKDARANVYLKEDAEAYENQPKEWQPPKWTKGLVVKPSPTWRDNCIIFFGGLSALGIFLPTQADGMRLLSLLLSAAFMAQRGTPEAASGTGMRGKVGKHTFLAFGLAFVTYVIIASIASTIANSIPGLDQSNFFFGLQNLIVASGMGVVTAFLQPYKKGS